MKKILIYALVFFFSIPIIYAQKRDLGEVTVEELEQKVYPQDTSAVAVVLFEIGETQFNYTEENGFGKETVIHTKIKIYKKEGYDYANKTFNYYIGSNPDESVSFSNAITYNLIGGKIEKTKLKSDGEFTVKKTKNWAQKKIVMPNVMPGSIIEYKIRVKSPFLATLIDWNFQKSIPVVYSEYNTLIPEFFYYNLTNKGFVTPIITKESKSKTLTYTYKERGAPGINEPLKLRVTSSVNYQENSTKFVCENLPALKDESYVNNIDNYRVAVIHELSGKRMPQSTYVNYATDWEGVVKSIYESESFGEELKKTGYFEKDIDALLGGVTVSNERLYALFNYVKETMNFNENESFYCDEGVKKAYKNKSGNCAEINLMLTSMLRYAGFNANPVLVSTRSNGITYFPSRTAYNYVVVAVEIDSKLILLDATNKNSLPDILPFETLNWFGRLIRKDGTSSEIDLMPKTKSIETTSLICTIASNAKVTGKVRKQYFNYNAFGYREVNNMLTEDDYLEKLEKKYQGIEITDFELQNKNELAKPIVENYSFESQNGMEVIGDKMYFSPLLFFAATKNPFTQENREYPIDFFFPQQDKYTVSITIPDGYEVETMPQAAAVVLADGLASYKYISNQKEKIIQLMYSFEVNQAIIGPEYYASLKEFYKGLLEKQNDKIVLKKI